MLKVLRRIIQDVNEAPNFMASLQRVVEHVCENMGVEASSIFLLDPKTSEQILMANRGLTPVLTGNVRLKYGEGLVGLVAEREEPINIADAQSHPKYLAYPGIGEEDFHAFLGVPIINRRELVGVMIVQQAESRRFDEAEEAFLATLSAQLGNTISNAQAAGDIIQFLEQPHALSQEISISGVSGSQGVATGLGIVVFPTAILDAVPDKIIEDTQAEIQRFESAMQETREEIRQIAQNLAANDMAEEREIFDAYLRLLDSPSMINSITAEIVEGQWAQGAVKKVIKQHIKQFEEMDDVYLRERAQDVKDLGERVLSHLQQRDKISITYPEQTILVGENITPVDLAEVPNARLAGVISVQGSSNSHIAILARAMGVPTVMGISGMPVAHMQDKTIIVDGYYGQIYVQPTPQTLQQFETLIAEEKALDEELEALRELSAETLDAHCVKLYVNTGLAADIGRSLRVGAEGVGLYRTEVPFMVRDRFPSEEEQRVIYRQLLKVFSPRPVILRTLDIGGDKSLPYFPIDEENPFLGWRGIRLTLDHPEIFLVQARAMMRASIGLNNAHILLPMISGISEIEEATRLLTQAHSELMDEGYQIDMPAIGAMVEVPSAVYQCRGIARRVDFLSVGSNDLTQYILAVDRNNARVASMYDSLHPAVIMALQDIVKAAQDEDTHVSICGEMAGDPAAVIILLALGFDTLSMSANQLPKMKWVIRKFTLKKAQELLHEVLEMDDPIEIRCHLELALEQEGLGGLIRAGR